jgi:hypothetical protein
MSKMREIKLGGDVYQVRGLIRRDLTAELKKLGYSRWGWEPPTGEDGEVDSDKSGVGMDLILETVLGEEKTKEIEEKHSLAGLRNVWRGILKETYGAEDEEKNSSKSGRGVQTKKSAKAVKGAESTK